MNVDHRVPNGLALLKNVSKKFKKIQKPQKSEKRERSFGSCNSSRVGNAVKQG
jgi:hypothetical protein